MYNDLKTLLEIVGMTNAMQRRISMALRLGLISQEQATELAGFCGAVRGDSHD